MKDKEWTITRWGEGLDALIEALRDFRESLGMVHDDAHFMRLYGAICAAGGDLDGFVAGDVNIDGLRELLTEGETSEHA